MLSLLSYFSRNLAAKYLAVSYYLWHKTAMPVFLERFILPVFAAVIAAIWLTNPMSFDTTQKVTMSFALVFLALFVAHTVHLYNQASKSASPLSSPSPLPEERSPGFALFMSIRIHNLGAQRRKYILDIGGARKSRLSVYIDAENVFTLSLLDVHGEQHPLRVPLGASGIPLGELVTIVCDFGARSQSTTSRIFVNAKEVSTLNLPFKINPGSLDLAGGVIGSDLKGRNGAQFDLFEFGQYDSSLTSTQIGSLFGYFSRRTPKSFVQFSGTQFMTISELKDKTNKPPAINLLPGITAQSKLSNEELKATVSKLIFQMRQLLLQREKEFQKESDAYTKRIEEARSEEERQEIRSTYSVRGAITLLMTDYDTKFKNDAILFRDELLFRLSRDQEKSAVHNSYERPTNFIGLREVIDHLEMLVKSLPDKT